MLKYTVLKYIQWCERVEQCSVRMNTRQIIIAISKLISGNFLAATVSTTYSFPTKQSFSGAHSSHITLFVPNDWLPGHWELNVCLSWMHQQTPEVFHHHTNTLYSIYQQLRAASIKYHFRSQAISHESYIITSSKNIYWLSQGDKWYHHANDNV